MRLARRVEARVRSAASRLLPARRLRHERDALATENAELRHELERVGSRKRSMWHHPYRRQPLGGPLKDNVATANEDRRLVERIVAAYAQSVEIDYYGAGSWWHLERELLGDIHQALAARDVDAVTQILRSPMENSLFHGYEIFTTAVHGFDQERWRQDHADRCQDILIRLVEALGGLTLENPEGGPWGENMDLSTEDSITRVEKASSISLPIRPVHHGFHGLTSRGGVVTERMIHAAYSAHRVGQLLADVPNPRVLEIGAGLGYTAYYASQIGIPTYEIVDLPLTNVAQAYFLGRTLGPDRIVLEGEERRSDGHGAITIRTPRGIFEPRPPVDLVMNVDSLTEVGLAEASRYADRILEISPLFLSINHEVNPYTVRELFSARGAEIRRFPYWLRVGYVEEIIRAR